jgi:dTDP-4-dehydrorhamnose reductase
MRRLRIGVTGLSGYLGERLAPAIVAAGHEVLDLGRAAGVDLTDPATVGPVVIAASPDAVIHAAAANPGRPESTFDAVNRAGTAAVAEAVVRAGARLVHVSTDVVHDGRHAPYADDAAARPCNEYGRTKAAAEAAVAALDPSAVVVRTSLIYGLHRIDRSTAGFAERLQRGEQLALFADVIRQPVWVEALATGLVRLATDLADVTGTLNLAGGQAVDRATFGRRLLRHWGVDLDRAGDLVTEVRAAERTTDVPLDLRLRLDRAVGLGLACPGVDEVLAAHRR